MKIIWCTVPEIWSMWRTEFFVILDCYLPFYPPNTTQKIKILKNWEKHHKTSSFYTSLPEIMIIILLHCCYTTIATFLLYCCYTAIMIIIMLFCSWDMACNRCNWYFLPFYSLPPPHHHPSPPPNNPKSQNWKEKKKQKNAWRYHHFIYAYQKLWSNDVRFLRYGARWTDGQKKWHIEVGAPPKNLHQKTFFIFLQNGILKSF